MIFAAQILLFAIYAIVIIAFLRVFYFQFWLILQIWQFIYGHYGVALWRAFQDRARHKAAFDAWRSTPPTATLRQSLRRSIVHLGLAFVALFIAIQAFGIFAPAVLEGGLFAR